MKPTNTYTPSTPCTDCGKSTAKPTWLGLNRWGCEECTARQRAAAKQRDTPRPASQEMDDLLARVVEARGLPNDVDAWAQRIAQDVADLND